MYFGNEWLQLLISFMLSGYEFTKLKYKHACDLVLRNWKLVRDWSKMFIVQKKLGLGFRSTDSSGFSDQRKISRLIVDFSKYFYHTQSYCTMVGLYKN